MRKHRSKLRPSPAAVVAIVALIVALTGTSYAALAKNSVGARQLKPKSVTTGKIARNAVTGAKVVDGSLTSADINVDALGTVPRATEIAHVGNADTISGHSASCPPETTLIRGICFDSASNPEADGLKAAADACAQKGGWLPTPAELYSAKSIINLGTGVGTDQQLTDAVHSDEEVLNPTYYTMTIDGTGALERLEIGEEDDQDAINPSRYFCVYPLVR